MHANFRRALNMGVLTCIAAGSLATASAANQLPQGSKPTYQVRRNPKASNSQQLALNSLKNTPYALQQVTTWVQHKAFQGKTYYEIMVGTDPARGSATTTVPVVIIPIKFNFGTGGISDPTQNACGDTESVVQRIIDSPIFSGNTVYSPGGTTVGTGQYEDAFQRANYWSKVSTVAPNYHVLFGTPTLAPVQTINDVPTDVFFQNSCGQPIAGYDINAFDPQIQAIYTSLHIPRNTLPLFVSYNVFLTEGGGCCILGYHGTDGSDQNYSFAAFNDPGLFNVPIEDIHALSHELGEYMDDPFGSNPVAAWGHIGQQPGCQGNLEVGDPVTGTAFTVTGSDGFVYHPEDLVFHDWFLRGPSTCGERVVHVPEYVYHGRWADLPVTLAIA